MLSEPLLCLVGDGGLESVTAAPVAQLATATPSPVHQADYSLPDQDADYDRQRAHARQARCRSARPTRAGPDWAGRPGRSGNPFEREVRSL
jgi:hypothetical protein